MSKFKDGELVKWSSQAAGCSKEKTGKIAQVVAAGQLPDRDRFLHLYKSSGVGIARNHESYVVMVGMRPYWPRVTHLKPVTPENPWPAYRNAKCEDCGKEFDSHAHMDSVCPDCGGHLKGTL
jgi:tRNA(Ile2) C34 agmatinyltransferase TiaS